MIRYAGALQLGDYVAINDDNNNYVRLVTSIIANIGQPITYHLDNGVANWGIDELTRVKPEWNIGELVRYKGRVHQIFIIEVKNYKFVYSLDNIGQWIAEDELEHVDDIRHSLCSDDWISVNKYCIYEQFRGMKGRINVISHLGVNCSFCGIGPQSYDIAWEAIDVEEKKVEPYNAELICVHASEEWGVGEVVEIENGTLYYRSNGMIHRYPYNKFNNIEDVNKSFTAARFAEIKETIGDKEGWSGKFYVVEATADGPLKVGNVYIVKKGILNIGGYTDAWIFTSFEDIQKRFPYLTLIEVKEGK